MAAVACRRGASREHTPIICTIHDMTAHASALRHGRYCEPGLVYLITTVTRARRPVFAEFEFARMAIGKLHECDTRGMSHTLAFVLMPDHLHWLVQLMQGSLPTLMGQFKANAARVINSAQGSKGLALWQDGYHDHALRHEEDLRVCRALLGEQPGSGGSG